MNLLSLMVEKDICTIEVGSISAIIKSKINDATWINEDLSERFGTAILEGTDKEGISYCEKIQQVFNDPRTSHLW